MDTLSYYQICENLEELQKEFTKLPNWQYVAPGELPTPIDDIFSALGLYEPMHPVDMCNYLLSLLRGEEVSCGEEIICTDREGNNVCKILGA